MTTAGNCFRYESRSRSKSANQPDLFFNEAEMLVVRARKAGAPSQANRSDPGQAHGNVVPVSKSPRAKSVRNHVQAKHKHSGKKPAAKYLGTQAVTDILPEKHPTDRRDQRQK